MSEKKENPVKEVNGIEIKIEGDVQVGGDFVGGDKIIYNDYRIADSFEKVFWKIETHPNLSEEQKSDLKADVQKIQENVGESQDVDESFLERRLRTIKRIAPDIWDVIVTTFSNPIAGINLVFTKIAQRAKENEAHK